MHDVTHVLIVLFVAYVGAQLGAEVAQRLRMPAVVGEICAGMALGPSGLGWVASGESLDTLAELGAVLLLFSVGLETRASDLRRVGRVATYVGVAGVALPFALGVGWAISARFGTAAAMFVGAAFVATSAGITARVLAELGIVDRLEGRVILGAAVIDDILAMLLLGVATALLRGGGVNAIGLALVLLQAVAFVAVVLLVGPPAMRRASPYLEAPVNPLSPLTLVLAGCLGLAAAASQIGLAAIIGAFLAGVAAAETSQRHTIELQTRPIMAFLVPFFFVATGTKVVLGHLAGPHAVLTLLLITAIGIIGKLAGCGLGAASLGMRSALVVGVGMVPRGEVGIIVASLGLAAGVFADETYALLIAMSLLTSVVAPPALRALVACEPT